MLRWLSFLVLTIGLIACSEEASFSNHVTNFEERSLFNNFEEYVLDEKNKEIRLSMDVDSLEILSLRALGGSRYYPALDDDPIDPKLDWNNPLDSGVILVKNGEVFSNIVVLDNKSRIASVWKIVIPEKPSSGSEESGSSSSLEEASSSSVESSSSDDIVFSSSEESLSSSSHEESSSSEEIVSSDSEEVSSSSSEKILSSSSLASSSSEGSLNSSSSIESSSSEELVSSSSELEDPVEVSSSSVYEPQLPGSDFSERVDSFWGTTSDAMATLGSGSYNVLFDYTISIKSSANAVFDDSRLTLTTRSVIGSSLGISGGWKMAGGFYFAGSYSGTDAASIYIADNVDAGADNRPANFSQYMSHGRPFTGRPTGFSVTYAYEHHENTNDTYPQKSLIYVMLISGDKKVVAAGAITDSESILDFVTRTVDLEYGSDAGLIDAGYAGTEDLSVGTGEEDVVEIRVMFASSALAFVADGGTSSQMKAKFRGGEDSKLILDDFKLVYPEVE